MGPPRRVRWDCDVVPRGTLAASWPDMSKLVSNQSVGSIFSHRVGFDGVVEISTEFFFRNESLSSPGAAGPRHWPEGQLSPRADRMSASQSAIIQGPSGLYIVRGGVDPGGHCIRPRGVRVVHVLKDSHPEMGTYPHRCVLALCTIPSQ